MKIYVGSLSDHKLLGTDLACQKLGWKDAVVCGVETDSGQNAQPVGFFQTFEGAFLRAQQAKHKREDWHLAIGIENGIFSFYTEDAITLDIAIVVVITPSGKIITTTSGGMQFPEPMVERAKAMGFETTTVGSVIAKELGGDGTDPHSILTQGKITRTELLAEAVYNALVQIP